MRATRNSTIGVFLAIILSVIYGFVCFVNLFGDKNSSPSWVNESWISTKVEDIDSVTICPLYDFGTSMNYKNATVSEEVTITDQPIINDIFHHMRGEKSWQQVVPGHIFTAKQLKISFKTNSNLAYAFAVKFHVSEPAIVYAGLRDSEDTTENSRYRELRGSNTLYTILLQLVKEKKIQWIEGDVPN